MWGSTIHRNQWCRIWRRPRFAMPAKDWMSVSIYDPEAAAASGRRPAWRFDCDWGRQGSPSIPSWNQGMEKLACSLATQLRIMFLPFDHAASPWLAAFVRQTVSSSWHMVALLFTWFVGPGWWMLVDGGELLWSSLLRVPKASSHCLRLQLNFSACTQLPMKCVRAGSCCSPVGSVAISATLRSPTEWLQ